MSVVTLEEARARDTAAVEALQPLDELEAWVRAGINPWTLLSPEQRAALEELDRLDFLFTGQSRGCHYGACDGHFIDVSWRT